MDAETSLPAAPRRSAAVLSIGRVGLAAAGGILGALAASSCCILPLALFAFGVSGAWIGNLTTLAPYQPIFLAATAGFLGVGYYLVYRQPRAACADGTCMRSLPTRIVKGVLGVATVLGLAAVAFDYLAPVLLGA
jgi:mercuric ion transport protein